MVENTKGAKNIAKTIDTKTNSQARKAKKLNIIKTPVCFMFVVMG